MSNSSICSIDRALSAATTLNLREPESDGNEGVHHISQSSNITGVSPSDCFISYQDTRVLAFWRDAVGVFYSPRRLGSGIRTNMLDYDIIVSEVKLYLYY